MNNDYYVQKYAKAIAEHIFSENDCNSENCAVYTLVPVNCIRLVKGGRETPALTEDINGKTGNLKIDIVLCVKKEIALCVVLNPDTRLSKLFQGPLRGLPVSEPSHACSTGTFASYAKTALERYAEKSADKAVKHALSVYSVKSLCSMNSDISEYDNEQINNVLMKARAVDENLNITEYGSACGIMCCYSSSPHEPHGFKKSFKASANSPEVFVTKKYFKLKSSEDKGSLMPLEDRLKCIDEGIPCEKAYGQILAKKLNTFLNTSLREIMRSNKSIYFHLLNDIADAKKFISKSVPNAHQPEKIITYGDLVNFLYRMDSLSNGIDFDYNVFNILFSNVLVDLGEFVYNSKCKPSPCRARKAAEPKQREPKSLEERLKALGSKEDLAASVYSMPLGQYYYAASLLINSNYPNWLCREKLLKDPEFIFAVQDTSALKKSVAHAVLNERIDLYQRNDNDCTATDLYASLLFNILILPLVDINKVKKQKIIKA